MTKFLKKFHVLENGARRWQWRIRLVVFYFIWTQTDCSITSTISPISYTSHQKTQNCCHRTSLAMPLSGQFADKPTRGQSSRRLVNSQTRKLTNWMICRHWEWSPRRRRIFIHHILEQLFIPKFPTYFGELTSPKNCPVRELTDRKLVCQWTVRWLPCLWQIMAGHFLCKKPHHGKQRTWPFQKVRYFWQP